MDSKIVFKQSIIENNIDLFLEKTKHLTKLELLFPVKACSNNLILNMFKSKGFGFDISNQAELDKVKMYNGFLSMVGPKCKNIILDNLNHYIIFYDNILDYINSKEDSTHKGLRINFNKSKCFDFSHFGIPFNKIELNILQEIKNIHFHISGNKLIPSLTKQIFKIIKLCKNLQVLDIGGGYEDLEVDEMVEFLSCIHNRLKDNQILIVECGDMWFKNAGKLYTYVLSVKDIAKNTKIIYLPISKEGNLKWSSPVFIDKNSNKNQNKIKYYFYGATCYEKDLIAFGRSDYVLQENDLLEFEKISPYSAEWNTSFNGIDKIEVVYE